MGTRNLTIVKLAGEYRVAQYGQWDGYPEGQGMTCLKFLREEMQEERFKTMLLKSRFASPSEIRDILSRYTKRPLGMTLEEAEKFKKERPELSRDTGAGILKLIQDSRDGLELDNELDFIRDSLFCEWAWVIDLDARTFEGYEGFNQTPLEPSDRFYPLGEGSNFHTACYGGGSYYPPRVKATFSLDDLPDDKTFYDAFKDRG